MTQRGEAQVIAATVPLAEMFGYSTKLRSMSQGRAVYSMEFAHYEEVPKTKAEEIISKAKPCKDSRLSHAEQPDTGIRAETWPRRSSSGPSRT